MGANDNVERGREYNRECDFGKNSLTGHACYLPARQPEKIDTMEALRARANRKPTDPSKEITIQASLGRSMRRNLIFQARSHFFKDLDSVSISSRMDPGGRSPTAALGNS